MANDEPIIGEGYFATEDREVSEAVETRLTVGDGFRFGCGLMVAFLIFFFAILIVLTALVLLGALLNLRLPFLPS